MAGLTILFGADAGKHFILANRPLSIGRDPSRDIQLVDPKVSRKHAMIRREGETHVVMLVKALNGVQINGKEVQAEATLSEGDEILLGDTVLRYSTCSDAERANSLFERKAGGRENRDKDTMM